MKHGEITLVENNRSVLVVLDEEPGGSFLVRARLLAPSLAMNADEIGFWSWAAPSAFADIEFIAGIALEGRARTIEDARRVGEALGRRVAYLTVQRSESASSRTNRSRGWT